VPRLTFDIDIPAPLFEELTAASREARIHPALFAAEALESTLASRRLEFIKPGRCGPRIASFDLEDSL
jgi:hypothetical protein